MSARLPAPPGHGAALPAARRHAPRRLALALEPRFMFDAAGAATTELILDEAADPTAAAGGGDAGLAAALVEATAGVAQAATAATGPTEVVAIDTGVEGWEALRDAAKPGAEVILLDPTRDGLAQLVEALDERSGISAIHVLSHGGEGQVQLGSLNLDAAAVESRAADLAALGGVLAADADLLLYGCRVAGGPGEAFLGALAAATGADVAASTDDTGAAARGGD
jgi:hypothetical protein